MGHRALQVTLEVAVPSLRRVVVRPSVELDPHPVVVVGGVEVRAAPNDRLGTLAVGLGQSVQPLEPQVLPLQH